MNKRDLERIFKALANERRLTIVTVLKDKKELSVGEIASLIKLSFRATSRHLSVLYSADIVEKEQKSLQIFYRMAANPEGPIRQIISII